MLKLEDDIDALFRLPLDQFIEARKTLAARLKKSGHGVDASRVKVLVKPPISAWTVNQLYWNHREQFDELMSSGQRFRKAQKSGKVAEMRDALNSRTEALTELSELAASLLSEAGHNPSLDAIRRISSTLEAVSAYGVLPGGATLGRLSTDVDPPGFESLAAFTGTASVSLANTSRTAGRSKKSEPEPVAAGSNSRKSTATKKDDLRAIEAARQKQLADAKVSLQDAKKSLTAARAKAQSLESQQMKAEAAAKEAAKRQREAEKESRLAEERLKRASTAMEAATRRAQTVKEEVEEASENVENAQREVDKATNELESLFGGR